MNTPARHPFLDDLTLDVELVSTILRKPVSGRENVTRVVEAVGSFYKSQAPIFFESAGTRGFLQYEAVLGNGLIIHGTVVIEHNPDGSVPRVSVTFSPWAPRSRSPVGSARCSTRTLARVCSSEGSALVAAVPSYRSSGDTAFPS
jgi:hypothetical protein